MDTPFPATPCEVVALSVREFTGDLDVNRSPSIDLVCQRFIDDANRALVWLIRFRALEAWCARPDMSAWLLGAEGSAGDAFEVAASFTLNDEWGFDAGGFRAAVESAIARRLQQ